MAPPAGTHKWLEHSQEAMDQYINTSNLNIGLVVFKECPPGFLVVRALDGCVAWLRRCAKYFGRDWRRSRHVHIPGWARRLWHRWAHGNISSWLALHHLGLQRCAGRVLYRYRHFGEAGLSRGWRTAHDGDTAGFSACRCRLGSRTRRCGLHGLGLAFRIRGAQGGWKFSLHRHRRSTFRCSGFKGLGIRAAFGF